MDHHPPSYNPAEGNPQNPGSNDTKEPPPSYESSHRPSSLITGITPPDGSSSAASSSDWQALALEKKPTLTLDGCNIYSATHPSRILYILSNPPVEAARGGYGIEKVYYKTHVETGEVKRSRKTHMYDLGISLENNKDILVDGQRASKFTFRQVTLSPGISGSHYKAVVTKRSSVDTTEAGFGLRVSPVMSDPKSKLSWKLEAGAAAAVATETRGTRNAEGTMVVQPRLEVLAREEEGMGEREVDLLVAAWCARVWKDALKDTKEPMTWSKFKRIGEMKVGRSSGPKMGGFL